MKMNNDPEWLKRRAKFEAERGEIVSAGAAMIKDIIDRVILRVAELPGRSSPDDQPEMMLVSAAELREILLDELRGS